MRIRAYGSGTAGLAVRLALVPALAVSLGLVGGAVAAAPAAAEGRTLYVATTGSDYAANGYSTPDNSLEHPWRTIYMAIRRAQPGDRIVVRGGTYVEAAGWGAKAATAAAPITLEPYPGEEVTLQGTLQLDGASYWTVRGLHIAYDPARGRTQFLVKFNGGTGWQLLDTEISGTRGVSNLMVTGNAPYGPPHEYRIAGNCIHDNAAVGGANMNYHNVYLMPGYSSGPGIVEHNIIFGAPNGANIKAAGSTADIGAADVVVRYNTLASAGAGVSIAYRTSRVRLERNLVGPHLGGPATFDTAVNGNHVSGTGNVASDTAVYAYASTVSHTDDSRVKIAEVRSVRVDPRFDAMACDAFHPADARAAGYGAYAS